MKDMQDKKEKRRINPVIVIALSIAVLSLMNFFGYLHLQSRQARQLSELRTRYHLDNLRYQCLNLSRDVEEGYNAIRQGKPGSGERLQLSDNLEGLVTVIDELLQNPDIPDEVGMTIGNYRIEIMRLLDFASKDSSGTKPFPGIDLGSLNQSLKMDIAKIELATAEDVQTTVTIYFFINVGYLLLSFLVILYFIWEQRQSESLLRIALGKAKKAVDSNLELLAHLSQEIRTPLSGITSSVDLLKSTDLSKFQRNSLDVLESSMEAVVVKVTDILDLTVLESGNLSLEVEVISLNEFLDSLYRGLGAIAQSENLILVFDWPKEGNIRFGVDPTRLRQVLHNLIYMMLLANNQGCVDLKVQSSVKSGDELELIFAITGLKSGLSTEQESLLSVYMESHPGAVLEKPRWMDLGLHVGLAVLRAMNAQLMISRLEETGVTLSFRIDAPLIYASKSEKRLPQSEADSDEDEGTLRRLNTVLIVDDIAANRMIAQRFLERIGIPAEEADSAKEALQKIQERSYDLVLMDLKMPEIDGWEATRMIRHLDLPRQPIILAMTSYVLDYCKKDSIDAGMDEFISKPVRLDDFKAIIGKFFDLETIGRPIISLRRNERDNP